MIKHIIFDWQGVLEQITGLNLELVDWIKENKEKYEFSILTNCPGDFSKKLKDLRLDNTFKTVVNPENRFVRKPQKEAYQTLLEEVDRNPDECLFIDDSATNVQAARSLNIDSLLYQDNKDLFKKFNEKGL